MSESKISQLLKESTQSSKDKLLSYLQDLSVGHTTVAETLGVSETSVRRWRQKYTTPSQDSPTPKILIWDIESSPIIGYTWGLFEQNVIDVIQDWKLLTISWSWYGSHEYHVKQLCDFPLYIPGELDDLELTRFIRNLLNEADYAVAHNGNAFDVKKVNAKFAEHKLMPPSPYTAVDTLTVARRNMKMSSNRLDSLGVILGVGRKVKHSGFELWKRCMAGESDAWAEMEDYARQDVVLLEAVFEQLLPWIKGLNYRHFLSGFVCTNCGSEQLVQSGGQFKTQTTVSPAWRCEDCGTLNREIKTKKGGNNT